MRCSSTTATCPRTRGTTRTASRSSRRSTTASAARRSSTAPRSTACARRTSASSRTTTASRPPGRSATTRWSRTTRSAEQLYQVHGARGEDPTEPPASAPYPFPAVSHEPRIQQLADDLAAAGHHPFHAPCGVMLDEARHAVRRAACAAPPATASRASCTPSPTPRCSPCARRSSTPTSRCSRNAEARAAGDQRERHARSPAWSSSATARSETYAGDIVVVSCGAANSARLLLASAQRRAPGRARQRLRPGRAELHVPQQPGGAGALQGAEPDGLPEDAGAQRLLLRRRRHRLPARQHPDGRQVVGGDVPRREAAPDEARAGAHARRRSPSTPSTSGSRPRISRGWRTA